MICENNHADTHIVEKLAEMVADGILDCEYLNVESEHSAMAACIGAQATGVRTFTATSSQGLALMFELLHVASGMRLPIVMAVANRALSAPLNIWNDWSDSVSCRDAGWIQLYCKNPQEALDTTIQAYRIAEDKNVLLPVMVCIDGFYLSHVYEPVDVPESAFLNDYKPHVALNPENPVSQGEYAGPEIYQEFKEQQYIAMNNALKVIQDVNAGFGKKFGRKYGNGLIETYNMPAENVIVTMGTLAETIESIIEKDKIRDIGIVRIKSFRPFPIDELKKSLAGAKSVGVAEKDVSLGIGGALWSEIRAFVNAPVSNFICGLGGRDVTESDIKNIFESIRKKKEGIFWVGSKLQ